MKILITGSKGQLGTTLQLTRPEHIEFIAGDVDELDITNKAVISAAIADYKPDAIINAAAYTQVDLAEDEYSAAEAVNAVGAANLAAAAKLVGARLIHLSTDYVFSGESHSPYRPNDPVAPQSVYGVTKLKGEQAIVETYPEHSMTIRTAWVYSHVGKNFLLTMLNLMNSDRDKLTIIADQVGTPTSTFSLAALIWKALESETQSGIYHWTDQGVASWYDFAVAIQEEALSLGLLKNAIPIVSIRTEEYPTKAKRPAYSVLDKRDTERTFDIVGKQWRVALREVLEKVEI